jgi:hypothetical protein
LRALLFRASKPDQYTSPREKSAPKVAGKEGPVNRRALSFELNFDEDPKEGWQIRRYGVHMSKEQGQQLGIDMANNFMLMTLFSIVADMGENPEGFRTDVKKALLDLTDDYNLPGIPADTAREARETAKQIINGILVSAKPIKRH